MVPLSLRHQVLQHLHTAHQGISSMEEQACSVVYWSGMLKDIQETREHCVDCNRNAPSQPATSPTPSAPRSTSFEAVFAVEVAVKITKCLLILNTGPTGSLDHDRFLQDMLQLYNTTAQV